jgi:hypothetical protein
MAEKRPFRNLRASFREQDFAGTGPHFLNQTVMLESRLIMETLTFRESLAGAIRYWEPRRLIYNAVLAAIVLIYFGINYPATKSLVSIDSVLGLFLLVVLANVAYCAAYLVDLLSAPPVIVTHGKIAAGSFL